jgi:RNA polymerase sigma-70 factor, ECF subfamily
LSEERLRSLLVRGLAGDARAYHGFLEALSAHLRSFLRRRLARAPEEVEDLVQELLLTIHNQRHTYDPRQLLTVWVYAIARYKLIDLLRRRARTEELNDPLDDESELFVAAEPQAHEARYDVAMLLRQLPDRQRLPIQYVKIEGASVADAATMSGMSVSAVKVGIHRGLKALAEKIRSRP